MLFLCQLFIKETLNHIFNHSDTAFLYNYIFLFILYNYIIIFTRRISTSHKNNIGICSIPDSAYSSKYLYFKGLQSMVWCVPEGTNYFCLWWNSAFLAI